MYIDPIKSHKDAKSVYRGCRSAEAGKPLPGQWRLFKKKNTFTLCLPLGWRRERQYLPVAKITPNDTMTMLLSVEELLAHSNTMVIMLGKITSIMCERFAKGKYRIGSGSQEGGPRYFWFVLRKETSQQYYKGIKFDLKTGECLNPEPDESVEAVPENRKVWLRELKRFKRGLKSRAKVGALTMHINEANTLREANNKLDWQKREKLSTDWTEKDWHKKLVRCMKKDEYPPEVLMAFVQSVDGGWRNRAITQELVLETVDKLFTAHSEVLRREYGVFGKTFHKKK